MGGSWAGIGAIGPWAGPDAAAAARVRREEAERRAHRLALEVTALRETGVATLQGLAAALTGRGVAAPRGGVVWTHTTVARVLGRVRFAASGKKRGDFLAPAFRDMVRTEADIDSGLAGGDADEGFLGVG